VTVFSPHLGESCDWKPLPEDLLPFSPAVDGRLALGRQLLALVNPGHGHRLDAHAVADEDDHVARDLQAVASQQQRDVAIPTHVPRVRAEAADVAQQVEAPLDVALPVLHPEGALW